MTLLVKITCMIGIITKIVRKICIAKIVPGILKEILKATLEMIPKTWQILLIFLVYKMAKMMNEQISHTVNLSMEIAKIRSSVTVTNLASLTKTVADKICHVERQIQQISGLSNDLWRKMHQEIYMVKWQRPSAASACHRQQLGVWIGKKMMQIGGEIWSGNEGELQIVDKFRGEIETEINKCISQLTDPGDDAMKEMWEAEISWIQGAEFGSLFNSKVETLFEM